MGKLRKTRIIRKTKKNEKSKMSKKSNNRITYGERYFLRGKSVLTTYSVWLGCPICERICFQIFFFQTCPFGGHFVFYQSEIPIWLKLLSYLSEKDVYYHFLKCNRHAKLISVTTFFYFEILFVHKLKMASTVFSLFGRERCVKSSLSVNFV